MALPTQQRLPVVDDSIRRTATIGSTPRIPRSTSSPGGAAPINSTITHQASDFMPRTSGEDSQSAPQTQQQPNASTTQVTPENTLRGRQIHFAPGNEALNQQLQQSIMDLMGGTDRAGIVRQQWESMLPRLNEIADRRREDTIKRNVALGRTGSGIFTSQLGDAERASQQDRETMLGQLLADASNRSVDDRFRAAGLGSGVSDQFYRQNLGQAEFLRGERGNQDQLAREATAAEQSRLSMLRALGFMNDPSGAEQDLMNVLGGNAATNRALGEQGANNQSAGFGNALQLLAMSGMFGGGGGSGGGSTWDWLGMP